MISDKVLTTAPNTFVKGFPAPSQARWCRSKSSARRIVGSSYAARTSCRPDVAIFAMTRCGSAKAVGNQAEIERFASCMDISFDGLMMRVSCS